MQIVYILHSQKLSRFYIGYTSNLETRLEFHHNAMQDKFTYNADDWQLYLKIECETQNQAKAIENHMKKMKSSRYIESLNKYPEMICKLLERFSDC